MLLKPNELNENGYVLLDSLDHQYLIPFVRQNLKNWTLISLIYTFLNVDLILFTFYWIWKGVNHQGMKFGDCVSYLSFGIIFAFLLILVHEYIHVLAYKSQGSNRTSYDSNWKKLYFMALADKFVANKKEFSIVALAPFVVINSILILGLFLVKGLWCFTILGTLMMSIHPDYHPKMKKISHLHSHGCFYLQTLKV